MDNGGYRLVVSNYSKYNNYMIEHSALKAHKKSMNGINSEDSSSHVWSAKRKVGMQT